MKVLTIFGSPRMKGNTATVLNWVEEELNAQGHEVERANIKDYKINGCIECFVCQTKPQEPGCPQKDDLLRLLDQVFTADAVVYASPLFCWSWTAQLKPFVDRHFCLVSENGEPGGKSLLEGKKMALLMTSAGPMEGNGDLLVKQFDGLAQYVKADVAGRLTVPFCTSPDAMGEDIKLKATQFARGIAG